MKKKVLDTVDVPYGILVLYVDGSHVVLPKTYKQNTIQSHRAKQDILGEQK